MKYSLRTSFARRTLSLLAVVFLLTVVGRLVTITGAMVFCPGWPLCVPIAPLGYLKLLHFVLVGAASLVMLDVWRKAWREQRHHTVLLPLTTITGVLFLGQSLVGALSTTDRYSMHLIVLHSLTAVALWISLAMLVFISGTLKEDGVPDYQGTFGQRAKDFFILSKPVIVLLLLVTTYGGLVAGGKAWPPRRSRSGRCSAARWRRRVRAR
ncbi:MAG: hypothetical protein HND47_21095 [Chloroflexi bacterium]|nr:hypothetical protein [Chloroflexota bacterium]